MNYTNEKSVISAAMEKKIKELSEFAAGHEIMIQNMNKRLKLVENVGVVISIVSISALVGLTIVIVNMGV